MEKLKKSTDLTSCETISSHESRQSNGEAKKERGPPDLRISIWNLEQQYNQIQIWMLSIEDP